MQCAVLDVSVNGYRKYLQRQKTSDAHPGNGRRVTGMALLAHIRAVHSETRGAYGWPRIWHELRERGIRVGKERVRNTWRNRLAALPKATRSMQDRLR